MSNSNADNKNTCAICGATEVEAFFELPNVPILCNVLWESRQEALSTAKGDIQLGFCHTCGHIYNLAFDPKKIEYTADYENALHFSPRFQAYMQALARDLIERHNLRGKTIIEIGCGQGEFLASLCELGNNRGIGFDPSYRASQNGKSANARLEFVRDYYSERYARYQADFIACRQVLEHICRPVDFLKKIRGSIGPKSRTAIFFEVPNVLFTLRDLAVWDILYEHISYFSATSLQRLFSQCGFKVTDINETFDGQFLTVEALPSNQMVDFPTKVPVTPNVLAREVAAFTRRFAAKKDLWQHRLEAFAQTGLKAVVWGAGSKGVTFLNLLSAHSRIEYIVDINPRKHNMFVAGAGQQIVPPEFLKRYQPDIVLIMNAIYHDEIQEMLKKMGLATECETV